MTQHLYIIQTDKTGAFKIGRSKNPTKRLKQLQTGCPDKLRLLLVLENKGHMEKNLHQRLRNFKSRRNGEWFDFDGTASLPDWIYEQIDWEVANTWWEKP